MKYIHILFFLSIIYTSLGHSKGLVTVTVEADSLVVINRSNDTLVFQTNENLPSCYMFNSLMGEIGYPKSTLKLVPPNDSVKFKISCDDLTIEYKYWENMFYYEKTQMYYAQNDSYTLYFSKVSTTNYLRKEKNIKSHWKVDDEVGCIGFDLIKN